MIISKRTRIFQCIILIAALMLLSCSDSGNSTGPGGSTAPGFISPSNAIFTVGRLKSFAFKAIGSPAPRFTMTGTLPSGLTFNDTTGILSGIAGAGTEGSYPLTIVASNGVGADAVDNFLLKVGNAILIVHDGTAGLEDNIRLNVSAKAISAGVSLVSYATAVPAGDLSNYVQIWDIRFNVTTPLTPGDIARYSTYLRSGGTLIAIGENMGFVSRDSSMNVLVLSLGGDSLKLTNSGLNTQTVQPPFNLPDTVSTITFLAGASTSDPGTGAFITKDVNNFGMAVVYQPGTLPGAWAGRLIYVFDCNFLDPAADEASQRLSNNMILLP